MSWQTYVDNNLVGTGKIASAAIHGLKDGNVWATSPSFNVSQQEIQNILTAFQKADSIQANGFRLNNNKYFTLRAFDNSIYGKQGAGGVCVVKTNQAVLIGVYTEGTQPGEANAIVEKLADYLRSVNY